MRIRIIKVPKQYQDGGTLAKEEINPGLDAMVKARLALDSHFGNPTARRMTNYDTRSYTFPDGRRGNVYVGSYGNHVTPQIQDVDGELKFIEDPWSEENWERSEAQSMKFESPRDAEYFAKNYKRFAPMMSLYSEGGIIQNAKKWHHAFGGDLMTHGADFSNGLNIIGNGGSHEENPFEGVPMGVDPEGTPNLVEEGETIFNDYVFSKRLMVPKSIRNKYKLGSVKNLSFADASKKLAKESEERPNDPISERGMQSLMADLASAQEELKAEREANQFALGGKVNKFDGNQPGTSQMRKRNTYKGVSGYNDNWIDDQGNYVPSYIEMVDKRDAPGWNTHFNNQYAYYMNPANKGSLRWQAIDNFYSANPDFKVANIELTPEEVEWAKNGAKNGPIGFMHTWGQESPATVQATTPASTTTIAPATTTATTTEAPKRRQASRYYINKGTVDKPNYSLVDEKNAPLWMRNNGYRYTSESKVAEGDTDFTDYYYDPYNTEDSKQGKYADWLRYAPAVGYGIGTLTDALGITNKPDYSNADAVLEASRAAGNYQPVAFNPIGNYLTYRPLDRDYYINKMNAEAGATRRNIINTSGGNRATAMAGLLTAGNNYLNQIGALGRQAEEYNTAQRQAVENFNRATNMTNSQGFLQADMANQKAQAAQRELFLKGAMSAAQMREGIRQATDANKSANISGLFQTLGDIGFEERNAWMRDWAIRHGVFGPGTEDASRVKRNTTTRKEGGKLKRVKRKRGLTF